MFRSLRNSSQGTQLASTAITLQGHSTQMLDLNLLAWGLPQAENQAGGLRLQYYGKKRAIMATGGLVDEAIGYSTDIPFWSHDLDPNSPAVPITYASVGLMVGQPNPGMGFPAGLRFTPHAVLENTTAQPLTVTPALNYMPGGSPVTLPLPVQQLQPLETRQLDLASMLAKLGLGGLNGDANLTFSITGHGGDLMIATESVDQTGNFVFPVPAEPIGQSFGKGIGHWTVANGVDSMYSLWNPTNTDQDFVVTLHYGDGSGQYVMPLHLAAQASTTIDIAMLIAMRQPDANGNLIPNYIQEGSVVFSNPKGRTQWMTLAVCGAFYNPRKATCGPYWTYCYGYSDFEVEADPFSVALGGTVQLNAKATYGDGSVDSFTTSSSWSSSNTSVATVGASTGLVTGKSPGSLQVECEFPSLVEYTGEICVTGGLPIPCPVGAPTLPSPGTAVSGSITVNLGPPPSTRSSKFSTGDGLSFANMVACGATVLGAQGCAAGWYWQVEVAATVTDNAANWAVTQDQNSRTTTVELTNLTQTTTTTGYSRDNPSASLVQQTTGTLNVFWLDSPGVNFSSNILSINDQATKTSRICSKVTTTTYCVCVDWNYDLVGTANLAGTGGIVNTTSSSAAITKTSYSCQPQK